MYVDTTEYEFNAHPRHNGSSKKIRPWTFSREKVGCNEECGPTNMSHGLR